MTWIFRLIVFISAFILFQLELITTQKLLPYFGGSFQVWSTALVFFNLVLLLGYATVDYWGEKLNHKNYPKIHFLIFFISIVFFIFEVTPQVGNTSLNSFFPIIKALLFQIGLPFYLLSMTLPLTQQWISRLSIEKSYNLYFYSGLGSVIGLLSYPIIFSHFLKTSEHWILLRNLYLLMAILFIPVIIFLKNPKDKSTEILSLNKKRNPLWILGSFVTCLLMLATTNIVSGLVGSIPLVWIIPLVIYLVSFMLVFRPWYSERIMNRAIGVWIISLVLGMVAEHLGHKMIFFFFLLICLYLFLFLSCTVINRQIYLIRPLSGTSHINLFLNIGGLLATIFMSIGLPLVGRDLAIQNIDALISLFFIIVFFIALKFDEIKKMSKIKKTIILSSGVLLIGVNFTQSKIELAYFRNFYNIIRIIELGDHRLLVNGEILHGGQFKSADKKKYPLHYYHPKAPFSDVMKVIESKKDVAVIGLGIGSMAYYAHQNEHWRFYEIDSDMEFVAKNFFSYLSDSKAQIDIIIGDGRLMLNHSPDKFDLVVVDAFSGDAVPAHLVTKEAVQTYLSKLKSNDGAIVIHVSNIFINLLSVIRPTASELGLNFSYAQRSLNDELGESNSYWCVITKNQQITDSLKKDFYWKNGDDLEVTRGWSDDYTSFIHPMFLMLSSYFD